MNQAFTVDYGWDKLISHQAYWNGEAVQIDFHLPLMRPAGSLMLPQLCFSNLRAVTITCLLPYDTWLLEDETKK